MNGAVDTLERDGRVWFRNALNNTEIETLIKVSQSNQAHGARINWNTKQAVILRSVSSLHDLASNVVPGSKPVRALMFNKSPKANWVVPWHQDRVVAVKHKHEVRNYQNWTKKTGVWHVEPPLDILKKMVFARIHLDDNTPENGCMEIVLGSHRHGYISSVTIPECITALPKEICEAKRGDVLFVKALTIHRSSASKSGAMRRVLRVDYSNQELANPLQWASLG
ncbi:MAG: phytanoyl-CoA dioxygenase family protein [Robiginitomaculum sp.]|nr:phytanoyl-CoA dioxygenase family protein [Robiginitomaculum sp.]